LEPFGSWNHWQLEPLAVGTNDSWSHWTGEDQGTSLTTAVYFLTSMKKMKGGSSKSKSRARRSRKRSRKVNTAYQAFLIQYYDILKTAGCRNMKHWKKIAAAAYRGEDVSNMCY